MLLKKFLCSLITFHFQLNRLVQSKAWPDQNIGWTNQNSQVNPFDVHPSQPNIGGNQRNDYSNNNFEYPYDNTRTTTIYPPFDGSTRRNTLPTRRQFYNIPTQSPFNNSASNIHNHTQFLTDHNNRRPNTGNNYPNQNTHNNGDFQHRPFPSPQSYDRNNHNGPNTGNNYQDRNRYNSTSSQYPPFQNSQFYNGNDRNQAALNGGSNYPNQNTQNNNPTIQNRQFPNPVNPSISDVKNQYQSNYQPNTGGNQRNDYSNNNFKYPYDNTRTTTKYPPFDGSTTRNTLPTRRQFNNIPTQKTGPLNNSASNNHNHTQLLTDHNNRRPNTGNNYPNQNTHKNGDSQHRPFPSPQSYDRNNHNGPNIGNNYQDRNRYNSTSSQYPSLQNLQFYNRNDRNQAALNGGSNYPNQNTQNNNPNIQNRQFPNSTVNRSINDGRNQYQSNYQPNNGGLTDQNRYSPSAPAAPQYPVLQKPYQPDYDPNGVALAPFSDENVEPKYGARKHFNYENLHHRYPNFDQKRSEAETQVVPLASYTSSSGVQVPLAPSAPLAF